MKTIRFSLTALAICAAATLASNSTASAEVVDLTIVPGLSAGPTTPFGVGCTYLVVARTENLAEPRTDIVDYTNESVMFPEELAWNFDPYFSTPVVLGHKVTLWTPTAPGEHSLMAYQTSAGGPIQTVTVNPATPIGPACIVAP
ncbi:hypothetical protein [Rhodococcoides kyotonense]|uniref:Secreted protein n=1 Tax=Rhodococcoides kyotonense TaxID=398843 RepID=A0A239J2W8_9NOCA|nr:hypothetical protein [Rhodococcus kyotonensis]SNS99818.1 hypothetical protein SAMN05421642_10810 [Rhodococcus kyotonensis]